MRRRLIIRPDAYADFEAAHDWYESQRRDLGAELAEAVLQTARIARTKPLSFPVVVDPDSRRALVERFPYAVYFRTAEGAVIMLAVVHTSRDAGQHLRGRF